jgi:pimeloyl-ACP methyl ester carboxylesterase
VPGPGVTRETWQHRSLHANGLGFHVVVQEPAAAGPRPLVLLLHGFPEFWYSWRRQIPALAAAGFSVAAPDLRGYNDSDKPTDVEAYRITTIVEDIAGIIRALGRERAVIVGHDWGGAAAFAFAMLRPEMTSRLCVMNAPHPACFARELRRGNLEQLQRSWYMFFFLLPEAPERLLAADGFRALRALTYARSRRGTFSREDLRRYTEAFAKPGALTGALNWYRASLRRGLPPMRALPSIASPTLVIWGDRDHFLGPDLLRGLRAHFSGPLRVARLAGVSHWAQQEAPHRVNALLLKFLLRPEAPEP